MSKKNVKTNLLSHSEAKVQLLGEYIKRYLNIICNESYVEKIRLYDISCGGGLYDNDGKGSPLVLLNAVKEIYEINAQKNKSIIKIDCYFNDVDKSKIEKLRKVIEQKSFHNLSFGNLTFSSNDYIQEVKSLTATLKSLRNEKVFIFIDPYGYKGINASQIKELMQNKNAEVLLWLPTQHMYRFSEKGTPEALFDFLDDFKNIDREASHKNVWEFIRQIKDGFQNEIGEKFFVDTFSIQKEANTVFCLYFFTSHIRGFEKMLEAKWEIAPENGMKWEYTGVTHTLFSSQKTNELEIRLKEFLAKKKCYNGDVYEFTLRQGYLPIHANEILESWQNRDILDVFLANGEKARKKSFYVKYLKQTDTDYRKVYFKLKI